MCWQPIGARYPGKQQQKGNVAAQRAAHEPAQTAQTAHDAKPAASTNSTQPYRGVLCVLSDAGQAAQIDKPEEDAAMSQVKRISTSDRALLNLDAYGPGQAAAAALAPLDKVASDMEAKWGAARLPRLVPTDMATKFGQAAEKLDQAIRENDVHAISHRAQVMIRGWQALDATAAAAGHSPMPAGTWSLTWGGKPYTVVLDRAEADAVARYSDHPGTVVTLPELLLAWSQWAPSEFTENIKAAFPGATVQPRQKERIPDDEIPF